MRKVFIDCGTHLGMGFSRLSTELNVDHTWEVFGFEANPEVVSYSPHFTEIHKSLNGHSSLCFSEDH